MAVPIAIAAALTCALAALIVHIIRVRRRRGKKPVNVTAIAVKSIGVDIVSGTAEATEPHDLSLLSVGAPASAPPAYSAVGTTPLGVRAQRAIEAMQEWKWRPDAIAWGEKLGTGSFGAVYKVDYGDEVLAAKRMDVACDKVDGDVRSEVEAALAREFKALQKVDHPNVVQLVGVILDHELWVCLLMERADRGSLRQVLDATPREIVGKPAVQLGVALDIAAALAHCHAFTPPLLHHDIKTSNVLIFSSNMPRLTAKVSDFGLAAGLSGTSTANASTRTKTNAGGGTFVYRAPETFLGKYTTASEVYSYAIVLWELLSGERPWQRDENGNPYMEGHVMHMVVHRKKRPELPSGAAATGSRSSANDVSSSSPARAASSGLVSPLYPLMRRCWSHEPRKRLTFDAVVEKLTPQFARHLSGSFATAALPNPESCYAALPLPDEPLEAFDVFISFRFGEAHAEALALKAALEAQYQLKVFLSDVSPGGNLQRIIAHTLATCRLAVVLATKTYGRQTNGLFCTSAEMNYIVAQKKTYYLVRMIPFEETWSEPATTMAFPPSIMFKLWLPGDPMPSDLVSEVRAKFDSVAGTSLVR